MSLTEREIQELMRLVALTKQHEIDCEQCLADVAEFAETKLAGRSLAEGLLAVEYHLAVCAECREEYEALLRSLGQMDG